MGGSATFAIIGAVTGIVGGITGVLALVLAWIGYKRSQQIKALDLRLEPQTDVRYSCHP